jgi:hypothetical protein
LFFIPCVCIVVFTRMWSLELLFAIG